MLLCDRRPGILYCYQLPGITLFVSGSSTDEHEHWTTFAVLQEQGFATYASSISCQSLLIEWAFEQQSSSYIDHQSQDIGHPCRRQASDHCERTILFHSFHFCKGSAKVQSVSFAMLNAEAAWVFQAPQTLVLGRFYGCWCCCVTGFQDPNVPATRNHVACSGSRRMSRALNNFCRAGITTGLVALVLI